MMKKILFILLSMIAILFSSCGNSNQNKVKGNSNQNKVKGFDYIAEAQALGFPTRDINHWLGLVQSQDYCESFKVTSIEADGEWCLKLYIDIIVKRNFRAEGVTKKAIISLWFEPLDGTIWSGDIEFLEN